MEELDETVAEQAARAVRGPGGGAPTVANDSCGGAGSLTRLTHVLVQLCASIRPHAHLYHPQLLPPHLSTELTRRRSAMLRLVDRCGACTLLPGRGHGRW